VTSLPLLTSLVLVSIGRNDDASVVTQRSKHVETELAETLQALAEEGESPPAGLDAVGARWGDSLTEDLVFRLRIWCSD
jgi:hypothetical protein